MDTDDTVYVNFLEEKIKKQREEELLLYRKAREIEAKLRIQKERKKLQEQKLSKLKRKIEFSRIYNSNRATLGYKDEAYYDVAIYGEIWSIPDYTWESLSECEREFYNNY